MAKSFTHAFRVDQETHEMIETACLFFKRNSSQIIVDLVEAYLVPRVRAEMARRSVKQVKPEEQTNVPA